MRMEKTPLQLIMLTLKHFEYKPNVKISWTVHDSQLRVHFGYECPDAREPSKTITITHTRSVEFRTLEQRDISPEEAITDWLWNTITSIEEHEAGEWFRIGGDRPYYPYHQEEDPAHKEFLNKYLGNFPKEEQHDRTRRNEGISASQRP